ncbi:MULTISPECIES: short-chain dehydrogenase/reductase [unclassified Gordonia (in: high G+C Gram-positive bacteria)]|uniref:short-chain dehydrogenase/reductase n=1 Tax=unclassified Gordonia (in: high G+C Gram-positive bacteria) TaxID=2657482 RepID=UPI0007EAEB04|nr:MULTISPECIES: short-chain dehydrogenase/reductase [unclassified Gordonia (in: high G+C Gram-positive bacteria)]OBA42181.1 short-chain dehydrogenase [Gordonia sp. 852002-51296_SCH5728562-b]OBC08309.1 short-chain dehydrogenase [Gordonia sp. 852002-50395_SCH5434458]
MSSTDIRGAVVLVTGAAQGIGLRTAHRLVDSGAHVVLTDVDATALESASADFAGDAALAVEADVRELDSMARAVDKALGRFGRLDHVVANAGITPPTATLRGVDPAAFDRVVDVNLRGVFNTVRACMEPVIAAQGHMQLVASCAAFAPGMGGSAYMITKSGVEQLGRALRIELSAYGASAGIAYFGIVETDMTRATLDDDPIGKEIGGQLPWPLNRRITADDAAGVLVDAIRSRRGQVVAPRQWSVYSALRGLINPLLDEKLTRDASIHRIVRHLDDGVAPRSAGA